MSKIIAIANKKGGVGKTTTCVNISAYLAAMGKKVLVVDIDPQGNATISLGIDKHNLRFSVYDALIGDCDNTDAIVKTGVDRLSLMPANIDLTGAQVELIQLDNRESVLKNILSPLRNFYDYIFIDCPPDLALLTVNALTAADSVLIPLQAEYLPLEGLTQLLNTVMLSKKHLNRNLEVEGFLLTMFDGRSTLANDVAAELHKTFAKKVFTTRIPRNIRLSEAPGYGQPIIQFDPKSTGGLAYQALAEEFLTRNNDKFIRLVNVTKQKK
jgi:chromosome partitioning protein